MVHYMHYMAFVKHMPLSRWPYVGATTNCQVQTSYLEYSNMGVFVHALVWVMVLWQTIA